MRSPALWTVPLGLMLFAAPRDAFAGLLNAGTPRPWAETRLLGNEIRARGVEQFLSVWKREKDRGPDQLLMGDEDAPELRWLPF
ncbi:hypothetical protein T484DRAFT_1830966 [Baffinella frigidus]|nr:hypothetical protein T484DRAFT_1830966 [Cryptophyta sp. CCMP2293]